MRTLFLVRHAKSSWSDPTLADHERPLNARGLRAARKMGRRLAQRKASPDLLLCSSATRALETARLIARQLKIRQRDIVVQPSLYDCGAAHLLKTVRALDPGFRRVMLVGHNPEITALARRLDPRMTHLPTCAVASFAFEAKRWVDVGRKSLARAEFDFPKKR